MDGNLNRTRIRRKDRHLGLLSEPLVLVDDFCGRLFFLGLWLRVKSASGRFLMRQRFSGKMAGWMLDVKAFPKSEALSDRIR